ncbi:MAG: antibiotic biosynthesis monooxygenase [Pseudomonadota bacterium]
MITITAIIRAKAGREDALGDALADVARHVAENEPETVGFFIGRDLDDPAIFTTFERFTDSAAKDAHNGCDAVAAFFERATPLIDGDVILRTCTEVSAKP